MRIQEPQESQESQQWQTGLEYGEYRANAGQYDSAQPQKIYPQEEHGLLGRVVAIVCIILASIGFGPAIVGIVGSSIALYYSGGQHYVLVGGIMGLVGSILLLIFMIAIFVLNVVSLARSQISSRHRP